MSTPNPAVNARARVVVDYGPDPAERHVLGLVRDTIARVQGFFVDAVVGSDADPERTFSGYGPQMQDFLGAASASATTVVTRNEIGNDISSGIPDNPAGDPARQIFAARLRRGRNVL